MALYAKADVELLVDRDDDGHENPWRANVDAPEDLEVVAEADMRGAAATGLARARRKAIIYTIGTPLVRIRENTIRRAGSPLNLN